MLGTSKLFLVPKNNKIKMRIELITIKRLALVKERFKEIEKVILPFLYNLAKSDEPYIHWPNRGPIIKAQIEKVLKLTRG